MILKAKLFFTVILSILIFKVSAQNKEINYLYQNAGVIKVIDKESSKVGYRDYGDEIFDLTLKDVGKYTGHVCVGVSSGFVLTKKALELLYPSAEIPVRGDISIAVSAYTDHAEVASYVTKAKPNKIAGKGEPYIIVDTTLHAPKKNVILIFKRNDTGKMVKAIFNKTKLVTANQEQEMKKLKMKVVKEEATQEEKELFATKVQSFVKEIIDNLPEGVITVEECKEYNFPENK